MLIKSTTVKSLDLVDGSKLTFDLASSKLTDVCITTPLFVSEYKNGINLGLVRMLNNNTDVGFGKGTNLNVCYKLSKTNDTTLVLTHPTFEQEQFVLDDNPENEKTTFKSIISDRYITKTAACYTLYDSNTEIKFIEAYDDLKQQYITIKGESSCELLFVYNEDKLWGIANDNELTESVGFIYDLTTGNCTSIVSGKKMDTSSDDVTQIGKTEFVYDNNTISEIKVFQHTTTNYQRKHIFTFEENNLTIANGVTDQTNTIMFSKLSTGKYYVSEINVDTQNLLISYNNYKTTLLLKLNISSDETTNDDDTINKEEYVFNKNYELSFVKVNDRIVKAFNYELNERHRLLSVSNDLYVKPELNGDYVLPSSYIQQDYNTVRNVIDITCPLDSSVKEINILYSALEETFGGDVSLVFNKGGTRLDVMTALVWYKPISSNINNSPNDSFFAKLSLTNFDGVIKDSIVFNTHEFNMDNRYEWNLMVLSIQAAEDFDKVRLDFVSNYYDIKLNVCAALYKDSFTTLYRYDSDGKIDATLSGKEYNYYKFNKDNQILLSKHNVYSYDEKGRLIQSVSPKKVYNTTTYSKDSLSTINILEAKDEIMYNAKAYIDKETEKTSIDTNGYVNYYKYDEYKRNNESNYLGKMKYIDFSRLMLPFETPSSEILQTTKVNYISEDTINFGNTKTIEICEGEEDDNPAKLNYQYDSVDGNLTKASSTSNNDETTTIKYEYDNKNRLVKINNYYTSYSSSGTIIPPSLGGSGSTITPETGEETLVEHLKTLYQCEYDDFGNIKSYNYGDSSKNVSYEYEESNKDTLNNIKKIRYCNQDKYEFEYSNDGKGLLSKVTSFDTLDEKGDELSINYEYDDNKLKAIKTIGGTDIYHTNELKYNQNGEAFIERNITGESVLETEYLDSSKITFDSINAFEYSLLSEQDDNLYWTMFIDRKISIDCNHKDISYFMSSKTKNLYPEVILINMENTTYNYIEHGLRMLQISADTVPYNFKFANNDNNNDNKTILGNKFSVFFCTNIINLEERLKLFSISTSTSIKSFELWFNNNEFTISTWVGTNENPEEKERIPVLSLDNNLHFVALNVTQKYISNDKYEITFDLFLDGTKKCVFTVENSKQLDYIDFSNITANVGVLNELSTVILNTSKHLSEEKIVEYTNRLKAIYNKGETYPENFVTSLDNKATYEYDTISLHNTFESKNGLKPIKQSNNPSIVNIQENFEFDENVIDTGVGNYVYAMRNQTLKYDLGLSNSGMVGIRFKRIDNKPATFLHLYATYGFNLKIGSNSGALYATMNSEQFYLGIPVNEWNIAIVTWSKKITSSSLESDTCEVKVYINGILRYSNTFECNNPISSIISLGKLDEDTSMKNETIGYIDKVIYNDQFISDETASRLHNELSTQYFLKDTFDDFGRKISRKVNTRGNSKVENNYEYENIPLAEETEVNTETNTIKKEILKVDGINREIRNYTYDDFGNISNVKISDSFNNIILNNDYGYSKGQLITELSSINNAGLILENEYAYDGRGNITSIKRNGSTSKTFEYSDNGLLLTKVNNTTITYDGLFPQYVKDENGNTIKELEFEGRRLKSLIDYNDNKKYCYFYNASGLREQKIVYNKTTNDLLSSVDYYYNSRNILVSEVRKTYNSGTLPTTYDIMYMYDSNGMLYAFKHNEDVFYYVRDALGNINHIVNQDGELESSYTYEAYGSHTVLNAQGSTSTSSTLIGNINPFRYKGYYYDVETQLFYCNSRYYSPELCRFISPDSIEYLDPQSINGLNLYCYCYNNPISYADPSGHSVVLALILAGTFAVGFGSSLLINAAHNDWQLDWRDFVQAGVDGLFAMGSTLLAMTGIGFWASVGIGAAMGWSQYALGTTIQGDDITWLGSLTAIGFGALGGAISGAGAANTRNIANNMVGLSDDGARAIGAITKAANRRFLNQISPKGMQATLNRWGKIAFEAVQSATPGTMKMLFMQSARNIAIYTPFANIVTGGLNHGYKVWGWI